MPGGAIVSIVFSEPLADSLVALLCDLAHGARAHRDLTGRRDPWPPAPGSCVAPNPSARSPLGVAVIRPSTAPTPIRLGLAGIGGRRKRGGGAPPEFGIQAPTVESGSLIERPVRRRGDVAARIRTEDQRRWGSSLGHGTARASGVGLGRAGTPPVVARPRGRLYLVDRFDSRWRT